MVQLETKTLKQIIEKLPDDFKIEYLDNQGINHLISDVIELNVSEKTLSFKSD